MQDSRFRRQEFEFWIKENLQMSGGYIYIFAILQIFLFKLDFYLSFEGTTDGITGNVTLHKNKGYDHGYAH